MPHFVSFVMCGSMVRASVIAAALAFAATAHGFMQRAGPMGPPARRTAQRVRINPPPPPSPHDLPSMNTDGLISNFRLGTRDAVVASPGGALSRRFHQRSSGTAYFHMCRVLFRSRGRAPRTTPPATCLTSQYPCVRAQRCGRSQGRETCARKCTRRPSPNRKKFHPPLTWARCGFSGVWSSVCLPPGCTCDGHAH